MSSYRTSGVTVFAGASGTRASAYSEAGATRDGGYGIAASRGTERAYSGGEAWGRYADVYSRSGSHKDGGYYSGTVARYKSR